MVKDGVAVPDKKGGPSGCENFRKSEKNMGCSDHGFGGAGGDIGGNFGGCPAVWTAGVQ